LVDILLTYEDEDFIKAEMEKFNNYLRLFTGEDIEENVEVYGDRFILRISMNNLLENAIKYGNSASISVRLFTQENMAVIEIKDQGIGIPESERKKIFKKFYRVGDEEVRETKGTGLGLFIVKETVEKHGGNVRVTQNEPQGSIFRVELPLFIKK